MRKTYTARLYIHVVEDLFLPSLVVGARRQRPSMHSRPPYLTNRQWALWWLVSGCAAGNDEVFHAFQFSTQSVKLSTSQRIQPLELPMWQRVPHIELSMWQRNQDRVWSSLKVSGLPCGCFRIIGKTNKI